MDHEVYDGLRFHALHISNCDVQLWSNRFPMEYILACAVPLGKKHLHQTEYEIRQMNRHGWKILWMGLQIWGKRWVDPICSWFYSWTHSNFAQQFSPIRYFFSERVLNAKFDVCIVGVNCHNRFHRFASFYTSNTWKLHSSPLRVVKKAQTWWTYLLKSFKLLFMALQRWV